MKDTEPAVAPENIPSDTELLLNSVGLLRGLEKCGEIAVTAGETTGVLQETLNDEQVALKPFRINSTQDLQEAKKTLWKHVPIWKKFIHENVLPFRGIDTSIFQLALVYDWGHNGNIMQYLEPHRNASRPMLVTVLFCFVCNPFPYLSLKLLQVANALQHFHSLEIVHGDLEGVGSVFR